MYQAMHLPESLACTKKIFMGVWHREMRAESSLLRRLLKI